MECAIRRSVPLGTAAASWAVSSRSRRRPEVGQLAGGGPAPGPYHGQSSTSPEVMPSQGGGPGGGSPPATPHRAPLRRLQPTQRPQPGPTLTTYVKSTGVAYPAPTAAAAESDHVFDPADTNAQLFHNQAGGPNGAPHPGGPPAALVEHWNPARLDRVHSTLADMGESSGCLLPAP